MMLKLNLILGGRAMSKKNLNVHLIFGGNGSGKSKLIRQLIKRKSNSYLFTFKDSFSEAYYNEIDAVNDMYAQITGHKLNPKRQLSYSQSAILQFCYELYSITCMKEPFTRLYIDGLPCKLDTRIFLNFLTVLDNLTQQGYKICFSTNQLDEAQAFKEFFESRAIIKETILP